MLYLRSINRFILISLALLALSISSANAASYVLAGAFGSELQGASGVTLNGVSYDVTFIDDTCINLFNGCDELSDLPFATQAESLAGAAALVDQIFSNGDVYDTDPTLTRGCERLTDCYLTSPWRYVLNGEHVSVAGLRNFSGVTPDEAIWLSNIAIGRNLNQVRSWTYIHWSPSAVPIPAAVWLFGTALIGLVGMSRRRKGA